MTPPMRIMRASSGFIEEMGVNVLRVWGGHSEKSSFYDLCDENGILVWQEACLCPRPASRIARPMRQTPLPP